MTNCSRSIAGKIWDRHQPEWLYMDLELNNHNEWLFGQKYQPGPYLKSQVLPISVILYHSSFSIHQIFNCLCLILIFLSVRELRNKALSISFALAVGVLKQWELGAFETSKHLFMYYKIWIMYFDFKSLVLDNTKWYYLIHVTNPTYWGYGFGCCSSFLFSTHFTVCIWFFSLCISFNG